MGPHLTLRIFGHNRHRHRRSERTFRYFNYFTHPLKTSWGLAAPDVFFLMSVNKISGIIHYLRNVFCHPPSANPKLSTTGRRARTVKNEVPSFISSATIFPRRFATTPYTFPRTSACQQRNPFSLTC